MIRYTATIVAAAIAFFLCVSAYTAIQEMVLPCYTCTR